MEDSFRAGQHGTIGAEGNHNPGNLIRIMQLLRGPQHILIAVYPDSQEGLDLVLIRLDHIRTAAQAFRQIAAAGVQNHLDPGLLHDTSQLLVDIRRNTPRRGP